MTTMALGWCPSCVEVVTASEQGTCPQGHIVNTDLDGPRPWVGSAGDGSDTGSAMNLAPTITDEGTSETGVGGASSNGAATPGGGLTDLHLSMLQEAPSPARPAPAPEVPHGTDDADDDLADLLAAELHSLDETPDDDLADLLAAELDATPDEANEPQGEFAQAKEVPQGTDLADLLAAELDLDEPAPDEAVEPPSDDLADLLAAELDLDGTPDATTEPLDEESDALAASLASLLDAPDEATTPEPEPPVTELQDAIGDVLAAFGAEDPDVARPEESDLLPAAALDLEPATATALDDDTMADLAALGLVDDTPVAPAAPVTDDTPDDASVAELFRDVAAAADEVEAKYAPDEPAPAPPPQEEDEVPTAAEAPAAAPPTTFDIANFTARGDGGRRRRGRRK